MNPPFPTTPFTELFSDLTAMESWLSSVRATITGTRFEKILETLGDIVDYAANERFDELVDKYGNAVLWTALSEAAQFRKIYKKIGHFRRHQLQQRAVRQITSGPFNSWDEDNDGGSIHGRNFLFELETAALFSVPGIKVTGFNDVDFRFSKKTFNVQCKRPQSAARIEANVDKAISQIKKQIGYNQKKYGIIAINIDKLAGVESLYFETGDHLRFAKGLQDLGSQFIDRYRRLWQHQVYDRILGVAVLVHGLCIYQKDMIVTGRQVVFDVIPQERALQLADYQLAIKLVAKIKSQEG